MCVAGHVVIGGVRVCLMEISFFKDSQDSCEETQSSPREGKQTSCSSPTQREKSPNWICPSAGSVGRGRLRLVSPGSAAPGFIGPFTSTQRQTWAKTSCVEQMGFSGTFLLALLLQACPIKHRLRFLFKSKYSILIAFQPRCAVGTSAAA